MFAIPLAPAPQFRPQPPPAIDRLRQPYQLPEQFALYLGINKPHKNLARLVEVWQQIRTEMPLVIAGAWDPRYEQLRTGAAGSARIRFLGRVPDSDLPALYSACRLFVFPSLYEGFGLPVVEALACGAAVACSNTSSLPEVGGEAAAYFNPLDRDAMRRTLEQALQMEPDPERSRTQAGKFSWAHTADRTLDVYRSLVQ